MDFNRFVKQTWTGKEIDEHLCSLSKKFIKYPMNIFILNRVSFED